MPLFVFKCEVCEVEKEVIRSWGGAEEVLCDECGQPMCKVISSGNFVLKGKGWAKDGYGGGSSTD